MRKLFALYLTFILCLSISLALQVTITADFNNTKNVARLGTLDWYIEPTNGNKTINVTGYCLEEDASTITIPQKQFDGQPGTVRKTCTITDKELLKRYYSFYTYATFSYMQPETIDGSPKIVYYTFPTPKSKEFKFDNFIENVVVGAKDLWELILGIKKCDKDPTRCTVGDFCYLTDEATIKYNTPDSMKAYIYRYPSRFKDYLIRPDQLEKGCLPTASKEVFKKLWTQGIVLPETDGSFKLTSNVEGATISLNPSIMNFGDPSGIVGTSKGNCNQQADISGLATPPSLNFGTQINPLRAEIGDITCEFDVHLDKDGLVTGASTTTDYDGICNVYPYDDSGKIAVHMDYVGDNYPACPAKDGTDTYTVYISSNLDGAKVYREDNGVSKVLGGGHAYLGDITKDQYMVFRLDLGFCDVWYDYAYRAMWSYCQISVEKEKEKCTFTYTVDMHLGLFDWAGNPSLKEGKITVDEGSCSVFETSPGSGELGFNVIFHEKACDEMTACSDCLKNKCIWCDRLVGGGCVKSCGGTTECVGGSCLMESCPVE